MTRIVLLSLIILSIVPVTASAQEEISLDTLQVDLWPEYDKPEMLVIYRIQLSEDVQLPTTLSFRIPVDAGEPNAVADGELGDTDYERRVEGSWAVITFTTSSLFAQLEYYDPGLTKEGSTRSFTYTWPGDYQVDNLQMSVQQPYDAQSLSIFPAMVSPQLNNDGLMYHSANFGSLSEGQEFELTLEYQKASDALSISLLASREQPDAPVSESPEWLPWAIGVVGIGLIGFGVYSYTQGAQRKSGYRRTPRVRTRSAGRKGSVYCHNCGTQSQAEDKFCRDCGVKLRS
jgi:hypothetical protein